MRCLQTNYSSICVKISILLLIHRYRGPPSPAGEGYTKNAFICFCGKKILFRHSEIPRHRRGISGDFREKSTKAYLLLISSVKKYPQMQKSSEKPSFFAFYTSVLFLTFFFMRRTSASIFGVSRRTLTFDSRWFITLTPISPIL